eukprot:gene1932-5699_t
MKELQQKGDAAPWEGWHEGCHLITKTPEKSPTFLKPLHHDSAAFNPHRAATQNITITVSFGAEREMCFKHTGGDDTRLYFPVRNGTAVSFGKDVNISWKHGVNALPPLHQRPGQGRVSIVLWGWCEKAVDEAGSPPLLSDADRAATGACTCRTRGYDSHSLHPGGGVGDGVPVCLALLRGRCDYGARCRFRHPTDLHEKAWGPGGPGTPAPSA